MKNRFDKNGWSAIRSLLYGLPFLFMVAILVLFILGISSVDDTTYEKQMESLETALHRSISQCYAVEGVYPPSLAYIEQHYGLTYDKDTFYVDYEPIGSNLYPEATVVFLK